MKEETNMDEIPDDGTKVLILAVIAVVMFFILRSQPKDK